jgi:ABC-type multidrug transport system ATPase subunit
LSVNQVYALCGTTNSGKTSTLSCLIDLLRSKAESVILDEHVGGTDYRAVFTINGLKIGVSTQGDHVSQVKKHLDAIESKCDIIFCATRTKGATCNHVIERYQDKLIWIQNMVIFNNKKYAHDNKSFIESRNTGIAKMLFQTIPV